MLDADDSSSDSMEPADAIINELAVVEREPPKQKDPEEYPIKRARSEMTYDSLTDSSLLNGNSSNAAPLPRGLQNLGNTCFMNSALQCLCRSPAIREHFIGDNNGGVIFEGFSAKFAHLTREVNTHSMLAFAPWSFKQAISERDARFSGYEQQDAQELAIVLLDAIHEDQKGLMKGGEANSTSVVRDGKLSEWERYLEGEDTIISRNFHGLFKSVITCGACKEESIAFDPFACLSLSISNPPRETFKVFRSEGDVLVQGVTKMSDDWIFKDGFYYEPLPSSAFYAFYAECDQLDADTSIEVEEGKGMDVCKVSKSFLLPTSTPLEHLRSRLMRVYPDVELGWSRELIQRGDKFVFTKDLMGKLSSDDDALSDIKEFFDTLFKEATIGDEYEHQHGTSLSECVRAFERVEALAANTWYCPNCKSKPDSALKQMHLHVLPRVLMIQLKRFEFNSWGGSRKLTRLVTYPESIEIEDQGYELCGVVEHFGSLFSGRYTARVRCEDGGWYNFDDSYVTSVSSAVNSRNAYLLFYSRRDND